MEIDKSYITNEFLEALYEDTQPKEDLLTCGKDSVEEYQKMIRQELGKVLCLEELEHRLGRCLEFEIDETMTFYGVEIVKYRVKAIKGLDFPIYHIKAVKPLNKTVLYLHGHDDLGIMGALLERNDKVRYHKNIPIKMAQAGYDVIAPELIGFGQSGFYGFPKGEEKISGCFINERYLNMAGYTLCGFRVFQSVKTLDFIEKLGLAKDITAFGVSGGGMICQHVSVWDLRIQNVLIACYSNTYRNSILAKEHCVDNYVPGLLRMGDSYKLLSNVAPRPLMTVNGIWDRGFPEAGSKIAFEYLEKVYEHLGVAQNYTGKLFQGKHEVDEEIVLNWLQENA